MADDTAALAQLRDIHLPEPVSWWPPAVGWWLLASAIALTLGVIWLILALRARRRDQRRALALLAQMERQFQKTQDAIAFAAQVSRLLRRVAVMHFPAEHPAGLTGEAWLDFLDRTGGDGAFRNGPGASLVTAPYRPHGDFDAAALTQVVRRWLEQATAKKRAAHTVSGR